jgi:hypothetical protein
VQHSGSETIPELIVRAIGGLLDRSARLRRSGAAQSLKAILATLTVGAILFLFGQDMYRRAGSLAGLLPAGAALAGILLLIGIIRLSLAFRPDEEEAGRSPGSTAAAADRDAEQRAWQVALQAEREIIWGAPGAPLVPPPSRPSTRSLLLAGAAGGMAGTAAIALLSAPLGADYIYLTFMCSPVFIGTAAVTGWLLSLLIAALVHAVTVGRAERLVATIQVAGSAVCGAAAGFFMAGFVIAFSG